MKTKKTNAKTSTVTPTSTIAGGEVFIVVLEDHHADPIISVHQTRAGADARFDEHKARYHDQHEWCVEEETTLEDTDAEHWVRYERTDDDGPSVRIERGKLEP